MEQKINIIYNKDSNSQALCWNLKLESSKNKNQNKKVFFWTLVVVYFNTIHLFQLWFLTSFNTAETDHFPLKFCLCVHVNLSLLNKKWLEIKSLTESQNRVGPLYVVNTNLFNHDKSLLTMFSENYETSNKNSIYFCILVNFMVSDLVTSFNSIQKSYKDWI